MGGWGKLCLVLSALALNGDDPVVGSVAADNYVPYSSAFISLDSFGGFARSFQIF